MTKPSTGRSPSRKVTSKGAVDTVAPPTTGERPTPLPEPTTIIVTPKAEQTTIVVPSRFNPIGPAKGETANTPEE